MAIKTRQITEEPRLLSGLLTPPATGTGKGAYWALDIGGGQVEAAFVDEAGNFTQLTDAGKLNLGTNELKELFDVNAPSPLLNQVLTWSGTEWIAQNLPSGGEANTASNLGLGHGIFAGKVGVDLQFKSLVAGSGVTLVPGVSSITISANSGEVNTASNSSSGSGTGLIFKNKVGTDLVFKRIQAGTGITITNNADDVVITSTVTSSKVIDASFTNSTGSTINGMTPVRQNTSGTLELINPSIESEISKILGIPKISINDGASGSVALHGLMEDVTTSLVVGDVVYLSKTGGLTAVAPEIGVGGFLAGDFVVKLGKITKNFSNPLNKDLLLAIEVIGQL
jgi:hypothetical protein